MSERSSSSTPFARALFERGRRRIEERRGGSDRRGDQRLVGRFRRADDVARLIERLGELHREHVGLVVASLVRSYEAEIARLTAELETRSRTSAAAVITEGSENDEESTIREQ